MTRLGWIPQTYSRGVDRGVLFAGGPGVPWNGLRAANQIVSGGDVESFYFDGSKTLDIVDSEDFALAVEAYSYPLEFEKFDGFDDVVALQGRGLFGFSYRTGTQIHLVYNAKALPAEKSRATTTEQVDPSIFSWTFHTVPIRVPGAKPTAHLVVETASANPAAIEVLEEVLYGGPDGDSTLPTPQEVIDIFLDYATLTIIDHGDGTWTAIGPDDMVQMIDDTSFRIISPSAVYISADTYTVSSY